MLLSRVGFAGFQAAPQALKPGRTFLRFASSDSFEKFEKKDATVTPTSTNTPATTQVHYINDIPYKTPDGFYQMVTEIPAGTKEKWQTDPVGGHFYHDKENGVPRVVNFLAYPFNYGIVPQTALSKAKGGDGDPVDIISLEASVPRGDHRKVKILGALRYTEGPKPVLMPDGTIIHQKGETDTKIVSVFENGSFKDADNIQDLLYKHPGVVECLKAFFEGYKGPGSFRFDGYASPDEAKAMIEDAHADWKALQANPVTP